MSLDLMHSIDETLVFHNMDNLASDLKSNSSFKNSTKMFINYCEKSIDNKYNITSMSNLLGFKQRRIYEVISVFEALGVSPKIDFENFVWIGFEQIKQTITRIAVTRGVFSPEFTLEDIFFNSSEAISLHIMTENLMLLYISMNTRTLNLSEASVFLGRNSEKVKAIKCKPYQAAAILEIAKIIRKGERQSEYTLSSEYFINPLEHMKADEIDLNNLATLLNRTYTNPVNTIKARKFEYLSFQVKESY